jgi:DNA polymerase delta subunit 3
VLTTIIIHLQRGTKRKSTGALLSDSDSDSEEDSAPPKPQTKPLTKPQSKAPPKAPPAKATSSAHVRRGVIFSSDEDDEEEQAPKKRLQKGKAKWVGASTDDDDEAERSLRAMMDVDDGMFYLSYPHFIFPSIF